MTTKMGFSVAGRREMLAGMSDRRLAIELVVASFVVLMEELSLIRWLPGRCASSRRTAATPLSD